MDIWEDFKYIMAGGGRPLGIRNQEGHRGGGARPNAGRKKVAVSKDRTQRLLTDFTTGREKTMQTGIKKDVWHFMDLISRVIPNNHAYRSHFFFALKCAILKFDKDIFDKVLKCREDLGLPYLDVLENYDYYLKRVPRHTSSRAELEDRLNIVQSRFFSGCYDNGVPLISEAAVKIWEGMLYHVRNGCLTDPTDYALYVEKKLDKHGIMTYFVRRGTSKNEGGIHQKIVKRIRHWNAGNRLSNNSLGHYAFRHNIRSHYRHYPESANVGHYR